MGILASRPSLLVVIAPLALLATRAARADGDAAHGKQLFAMAAGCGCHSTKDGPVGAGGRALKTPFGTFFAPNITPDRETGIGDWSDDEIIAAIRRGETREGHVESPVMPYYRYAGMADEDVRDLVAYLRALPAVRRANRPAEVRIPFQRLAYRSWRWLFAPAVSAPPAAPGEPVARGRYLVEHVAICGDCHTPRNAFGAPQHDLYLAGTEDGPDGDSVPNITPDRDTGIGKWSEANVVELLQSGMKPDMDNVQGLMAEMIDGVGGGSGYAQVPESELRSIAKYLRTVPPVRHEIEE